MAFETSRMSVQTPPLTRYWKRTFGFEPSVFVAEIALQVMTLFVRPTFQTSPTAGDVTPLMRGRTANATAEVSLKDVPAGGLTLVRRTLNVSATLNGAVQTGDSEFTVGAFEPDA